MSILVVGSVALDSVETPFGKITEGLGGSATHFSASASFFTDVHITAVVGEDFPSKHLEFLQSKNIDVSGIKKAHGKTFRWSGRYGYDLSNAQTLNTELNVFENFAPKISIEHQNMSHVFLANIDPELQLEVIKQVNQPKLIALDTMNFWIEGKKKELIKTLGHVHLLIINEGEARLLSEEANLVKAVKIIRNMGPQTIVIKQGEYGALLFHENQIFSAPGLPLEDIKDPTGAGDSFAGGFMGYLSQKQSSAMNDLKQAVIYGSVMASFNVEAFSCDRLRTLTQDDIQSRFKDFRKLSQFD